MSPTPGQRPIPTFPTSLEEFARSRAEAIEKYRPTVERLGFGELVGLSEVVAAEVDRRRPLIEREAAREQQREQRQDRSGIGNR